jgi:succinate dehydrogenase / fumarate reductase flavoprotein subunit
MLLLVLQRKSDAGFGVNKTGEAVYLDFAAAIQRTERTGIHKRIGC